MGNLRFYCRYLTGVQCPGESQRNIGDLGETMTGKKGLESVVRPKLSWRKRRSIQTCKVPPCQADPQVLHCSACNAGQMLGPNAYQHWHGKRFTCSDLGLECPG